MTVSTLIIGFVVGVIVLVLLIFYIARRYMVTEHKSNYDFDTTIDRLKQAVEQAEGWVFPIPEWHFSDAMIKHNKPFSSVEKLQVFFICKADYAKKMVDHRPEMASIMPCGLAVYQKKDGNVYIGSMNIPLMSKIFGGIEKQIFKAVGQEEADMLEKTLH